jgi:hypothetical protein
VKTRVITHVDATQRNDIAVLRAVVRGDGKTVAGGEPILGHALLTARTDFGGNSRIAGLFEAERRIRIMQVHTGIPWQQRAK